MQLSIPIKRVFFLAFLALSCAQANVILWDLGETLITTNTLSIAYEIGIKDFIGYMLVDLQNPFVIEEKVFCVLHAIPALYNVPYTAHARTNKGRIIPPIMRAWFAGYVTAEEIYALAVPMCETLPASYFTCEREKRLVLNTIKTMFNPHVLAASNKPITEAVELLKECAAQGHTLMIVSNLDPETYKALRALPEMQKMFSYFKPENIIISGDYHNVKPEKSFFEAIIKKHKLDPSTCILIDDRQENIQTARECSMKAFQLTNKNYKALRRRLRLMKVIT